MAHTTTTSHLEHLEQEASRLLYRSLALQTHQSFNTALAKFHQFRAHYDLAQIWPVAANLHFIAYLSINNFSYRTICLYISAMSYHHKFLGAIDNTKHFIVTKSLEGVGGQSVSTRRSVSVNKDIRLPISIQLFTKIIHSLKSVCHSPYESSLFAATYTVTFFGLSRVSEVLALQANHISQNKLGQFFITISSSKTDQTGRSSVVQIQQLPQTQFCPSSAITPFLQGRPPRKPTLFVHIDGSPVTRSQFQAVLDKSLSFLQVKGHYKSHSFRIGMATELANHGFSNEKIQELGKWRSNSFLNYIPPYYSH